MRPLAQTLTIAVIAALLGFFAYKQRAAGPSPAGSNVESNPPESVIWRMMDASRAATPDLYLDCYTGDLEKSLRQNAREMGATKFQEYLAAQQRRVKGVAVSPPQMSAAGEARISVEYVYEDRNETQQFSVRQLGGRWKIFRVNGSERLKTVIPYGTPVEN